MVEENGEMIVKGLTEVELATADEVLLPCVVFQREAIKMSEFLTSMLHSEISSVHASDITTNVTPLLGHRANKEC